MTKELSRDRTATERLPSSPGFLDRLWVRYGMAVVAVALGFLVRLPFAAEFGSSLAYITLSPAVMLAAVLGGFGPGLLATNLSVVATALWILSPVGQFRLEKSEDIVGLAVFMVTGVLMSAVVGLYRESRNRAAAFDRDEAIRETERRVRAIVYPLPSPARPARSDSRPSLPMRQFRRLLGLDVTFAIALILLAGVGVISYRTVTAAREADQEEDHAYTVIATWDQLLLSLREVEAGQRGFLVTGDGRYLTPYAEALGRVDQRVQSLRGLTRDNPREQLDSIESLIHRELSELQDLVTLRSTKGLQAARDAMMAGRAEPVADEIRRLVVLAQQAEAQRLKDRIAAQAMSTSRMIQSVVVGTVVSGILLALVYGLFKTEFGRRFRVGQELQVYQNHLQELVEARTRELRASEERLHKLNRTLMALSRSSQAQVRATDEASYTQDVCRLIVEDCGYAMVWIGFAAEDEAKSVRVAAFAGFEAGYLETLKLTWADTDRGRGPTGTAIRTATPSRCSNMRTDPKFAPWQEEALKRGYEASLALPLTAAGKAFGAITIYSREPDPFSDLEVKLLCGLADDLAYGIVTLRSRLARAQAEEALRRAKEEWERTFDAVPDLIAILDQDHRIIRANRTMAARLGTNPELCVGLSCYQCVHGTDGPPESCPHVLTIADGREHSAEVYEPRLGGDFFVTTTPLLDAAGQLLGTVHVARDITERKRAEEKLQRINEEMALFNEAAVGRELRMIEMKKEVNELCLRLGQPARYPMDIYE
jgi:PAS domain S-box-containing protein